LPFQLSSIIKTKIERLCLTSNFLRDFFLERKTTEEEDLNSFELFRLRTRIGDADNFLTF